MPPRIKRKQSKRCGNFKFGIPLPGLRLTSTNTHTHRIYPSAFAVLEWVLGYNKKQLPLRLFGAPGSEKDILIYILLF